MPRFSTGNSFLLKCQYFGKWVYPLYRDRFDVDKKLVLIVKLEIKLEIRIWKNRLCIAPPPLWHDPEPLSKKKNKFLTVEKNEELFLDVHYT